MSSLYELTQDIKALEELLTAEGGEVTEGSQGEILEKWMKEYQLKTSDKVDAYAGLIQNWRSDIEAIKLENTRLRARAEMINNRIERLKALARYAMDAQGTRKLEGQKFTISIAKNGGVLPMEIIVADEKLPDAFVRIERHADADKIRKALEANDPEAVKIAKFHERGESVRVK